MAEITRRTAIGTLAATLLAKPAASRAETRPVQNGSRPARRTMTLEEFRSMEPESAERVLSHLTCESFMKCHECVREETGVWVPELVPVFEKLDAMRGVAVS